MQRARDPDFDRNAQEFFKTLGPKRKVPLLLDENLELDFVAELRSVDYLKISLARPGASDEMIWAEAQRTRQLIVTADEDFWDDHAFPLSKSPGVVILAGRTAEEKIECLAIAFAIWQIRANWRRAPYFLDGCKLKASTNGVIGKHIFDGQIVLSNERVI